MGIPRKTKAVPKKKPKTRIEEFKFEPGKVIPIPPGTQLQWERRSGRNYFYDEYGGWNSEALKKLMEGRMPQPTPGQKIDERIIGEPKTPTDEWAEQWARENK